MLVVGVKLANKDGIAGLVRTGRHLVWLLSMLTRVGSVSMHIELLRMSRSSITVVKMLLLLMPSILSLYIG